MSDVESVQKISKECLIEEVVEKVVEVCGKTQGIRSHKKAWWWNF